MTIDYNFDIVDDYTGEVYREGISEATAREYIAQNEWIRSIVDETTEQVPGSSIDDPVTVHTIWVATTTEDEERRKREATQEFWGY